MTPLPFAPEELTDLLGRYRAAIAEPFEPDHLRLGTVLAPFYSRRHCFDFTSGVRLVLARLRSGADQDHLMIFAEAIPGTPADRWLREGLWSADDFARIALSNADILTGSDAKLQWLLRTERALAYYFDWNDPRTQARALALGRK